MATTQAMNFRSKLNKQVECGKRNRETNVRLSSGVWVDIHPCHINIILTSFLKQQRCSFVMSIMSIC